MTTKVEEVVVIPYEDLVREDSDLSGLIERAFGFDGIGILAVRGVPGFVEKRKALLPLSQKFATLPDAVKEKTVHKESTYSFGWSHGKEQLEGKPDFSKGSYYNNPVFDRPFDDEELIKKYPSFAHPNIWPKEDLPELEHAFKDLGTLIVNVGLLLSRHCDAFVSKNSPSYTPGKLTRIIKESKTAKARLLHYFPLTKEQASQVENTTVSEEEYMSSWCGWHNDHGSLTGLTSAMYLNEKGEEVPNPDPKSGLYARSRSGALVKATVNSSDLIFQIGETAQIHSGGLLQATPHCVRGAMGPAAAGISRETFAVFMEPEWGEPMNAPEGVDHSNITAGSSSKHLPKGVPMLGTRWTGDLDFSQFTNNTLSAYY
eukprot:TRINITY_DN9148_c0_g1_i1.p1 TRINITY_DN9148_c0_g1~~TRINITY_DN9148_c0_g1_i1.p1  ORF type:complete len:372 (+),score=125.40 TRINITY_DN9148_c0_g1_i1:66-1181(+)